MERLADILRRQQTLINTPRETTGTSSSDEEGPAVCSACRGIGWVTREVPVEDPDFGRALPCQCTQREFEEGRILRLQRYSGLGDLTRLTFANIIPTGRGSDAVGQRRFGQAYKAATAFARKPEGWLVFVGPSGCGKTHMAAAVANQCLEEGFLALFMVVPDFLDYLRATFAPDSPVPYDEFLEEVKSCPLLILDDLGTQNATPWAQEKLYQVLNHRFNAMLPTIVTTRTVDGQEERLQTRLQDPRVSTIFTLEEAVDTVIVGLNQLDLPRIADMTFEAFDPRGIGPVRGSDTNLERMFRLVRQWADDPQGWLVLMGERGCGKTHLAAALAHFRRSQGDEVLFVIVPELLDHLRSTFGPQSNVTYDRVFERTKNVHVLVLDDFGENSATPWAAEKLYQLINHRYNAKLPTVVTSFLTLEEIEEKVDKRIASRIADAGFSRLLNVVAPDYRHGVSRKSGSEPNASKGGRRRGSGSW